MRVPTEQDWGNWEADLDQAYAHKIFAGKTLEETMYLFEENVLERTSDLRFMPPVPFRYYMLGFRNYVLSERVFAVDYEASDAASCFLNLIIEKVEKEAETIRPIMEELIPAAEYIAANQTKFGAEVEIYGSFPEKLARVHALYETDA